MLQRLLNQRLCEKELIPSEAGSFQETDPNRAPVTGYCKEKQTFLMQLRLCLFTLTF